MKFCLIIITTIFLNFTSLIAQAQEQDNNWGLGYQSFTIDTLVGGMKMDFWNGLSNVYDYPRKMWFDFTNASISNDTGQLLFYTNGVFIANALDDTMMNGSGINPSWYTTQFSNTGLRIPQAAIIIPKPGNDSLYYLFHLTADYALPLGRSRFLYSSTINTNGNGYLGEVIAKNNVIVDDTLFLGAINITRHGNGRDWFMIIPRWGTSIGFYTILITPDTIQQINYQIFSFDGTAIGQSCFSPDGSKYIISYWWGVSFFDFDRCDGTLTFLENKVFPDSAFCLGASISPNSRYAYVTHGGFEILQYDLQATNIVASEQIVATYDGFEAPAGWNTNFWMHQLGPDGKIYINTTSTTMALHTIEFPDSAGISCNMQQHSVLLPHFNATLPNFPNYRLGALIGSPCDSLTGINTPVPHDFRFRIYPNPNNGEFEIGYQLPQNSQGQLEIRDIDGKIIWTKQLPAWSTMQRIHLTKRLPSGIYIISIKSQNYFTAQKLVIYEK